MVQFHAAESAVTYIRATPTFTIRSNKYGIDHSLKPENIQFDHHLRSSGKYVYLGITDTRAAARRQYELKLQVVDGKDQWEWEQATDPSLSPSSQDSVTSPTQVESGSLDAKRHNEIKIYLRYIKRGHDTIKGLEAFHQYRHGDKLIVAQYFGICDAGNVKQLRMDYKSYDSKPPEMFLWKMYYQLIDALAFLHNDHPKYQQDPLHMNRKSILHPELGAENVYLAWPANQSPDTCYPDLRLGDFAKSLLVSPGEGVMQPNTSLSTNPKYTPPEMNFISAKSDVWRAGSIIFSLAKLGSSTSTKTRWQGAFAHLPEERQREILMDPRRVRPIDVQYSGDLDLMIRRSLVLDYHERPSAGELLHELDIPAGLRLDAAKYMFKKLPDWVGSRLFTEDNTFSQESLNRLLQPGQLENARSGMRKLEAVKRREGNLLREQKRKAAKELEEEEVASEQWVMWLEREEVYGNMPSIVDEDILDAMFERWKVVRRGGIERGAWIDPGPPYRLYSILSARLAQLGH
ncbi:hypothetical protein DSL72_004687 [Monilinia vaccinii-corymbosi]|uniref:non-specific serine/threonine protein kinase n=1 Tax=Monilinia vaccinii-corymbosi TaxID=61207 RepID=A0A8A3P9Y9_9HELO|nr:hypothetical protein DSL72_004687 [Monilinia vaccinii-corymbosi]